MQQELRFATFNVCNLAPPGAKLYDNLEPLTPLQYQAKIDWTARQLDLLDADLIGLQEIFSLDALRQVLARTQRYRDAALAGFDPDPGAERLTPSVALVSRLPLAGPATACAAFPAGIALPAGWRDPGRFARAPLRARVALPDGRALEVVVVHLKSRRPDYRNGDSAADPLLCALASLRSLIWRGAEAVALRALLSRLDGPHVVLGDFNDGIDAVTTGIVLGAGAEPGQPGARLFDSRQIQSCRDELRQLDYTIVHEGRGMTIDHILLSEAFHPACPAPLGSVLDVVYFNDHLRLQRPEASDHGQVLARVRLAGRA